MSRDFKSQLNQMPGIHEDREVFVDDDQDNRPNLLDPEAPTTVRMPPKGPPASFRNSLAIFRLSKSNLEEESNDLRPDEQRDELKEMKQLAQRETTRMNIWRFVVLAMMLIAAAVVSTGAYILLNQAEEDNFETAYDLFANTIKDALEFYLDNFHQATENVAAAVAQNVDASNETFPFATVESFETMGRWARQQTGMEQIVFNPHLTPAQFDPWIEYSTLNAHRWIDQSRAAIAKDTALSIASNLYQDEDFPPYIYAIDWENLNVSNTEAAVIYRTAEDAPAFAPEWLYSPPPFDNRILNYDGFAEFFSHGRGGFDILWDLSIGYHEYVDNYEILNSYVSTPEAHEAFHKSLVDWKRDSSRSAYDHPHSFYTWPVFQKPHDKSSDLVGHLSGLIPWDYYLVRLLPEGVSGIQVVLKNNCNQSYTYDMTGKKAFYRGEGDWHDTAYDKDEVVVPFYRPVEGEALKDRSDNCLYSFHIYPTSELEDDYKTPMPKVLAVVVGCTFMLMIITFFIYDWFVKRRNDKVLVAAAKSNALVSAMFPGHFRDQVIAESNVGKEAKQSDGDEEEAPKREALADFYPDVTIMFSDLVGFTAWSSVRQPAQVFELLEDLYSTFDAVAKRRRVFKVETVGDSYVAAAGLPEPRKDHALVMVRFANECLLRMRKLMKELEVRLGPDTADLDMRFGLHSGSVTAGVLRGEKARFQLFGDTMNTASRMESTGTPGKIQISKATADLLNKAGKSTWFIQREDQVMAKGKGMMTTFWVSSGIHRMAQSETDSSGHEDETQLTRMSSLTSLTSVEDAAESDFKSARERLARCTKWLTTIFVELLHKMDETRNTSASLPTGKRDNGQPILKEVMDAIPMVDCLRREGVSDVSFEVEDQLFQLIAALASGYHELAFHNFDHASHVAMCTTKLLSAIEDRSNEDSKPRNGAEAIANDPLAQFACIFAAVIHDIAHPGVPNSVHLDEGSSIAIVYRSRAINEQNSFHIAWSLFLDEDYSQLRELLCPTPQELARFRQLLVNLILATDVVDKDLNQSRAERWEKCFDKNSEDPDSTPKETSMAPNIDLEATLILESIIQAADVSHMMQHWYIYRKWNKDLFFESYEMFMDRRIRNDPAKEWFDGEIKFFDTVVIPLAKRLSHPAALDFAGAELLDYAEKNREEWEETGREVVAEMSLQAKGEDVITEVEAKSLTEQLAEKDSLLA